MILQALVQYYEVLKEKSELTAPGWCTAKVSFVLELSAEGQLLRIIDIRQQEKRGKKTVEVPMNLRVPEMAARSSNIASNFLCDNSSYLLGVDNKGKPERLKKYFESAREKHLEILENANGKAALAVKKYFLNWNPEQAMEHPAVKEYYEEIVKGANLVFWYDGDYVQKDIEIQKAWESYVNKAASGPEGICLVTGQRGEIARTHGAIKGIPGAQSSGALLISFNEGAFESYGKEQSFNAPVSTYAVYAYTAALNYLIADKKHSTFLGDTTIVYWSEDGEEEYQRAFSATMEPAEDNYEIVHGMFKNLREGNGIDAGDAEKKLSLEQKFYILGLSPNAARLSVRFFYQDSFGNILKNIKAHYDRLEIVRPAKDSKEFLGIWRLLRETVNTKLKDKKPVPGMAGAVYRAILSGERYPDTLYQGVLGRIRAEQDDKDSYSYKITRGRAAIIKAYLLKNRNFNEEEVSMALNEESSNVAYTLGREFAVLEAIQEAANPNLNATIKDRYFNSACATPASIFPVLFKLKNSHIRKITNVSWVIYYENLLTELQAKLSVEEGQTCACPRRLTLEEQGMFILGYYHQTQKRFEKKTEEK